jgi:catechol 2,3-dioxygenase-like lactoylglutathione lyase family enzyme
MTIALQYCHITVNDPDESLGFYRDALGLEVRNDVETVRESGAEVLQEPMDQPWGPRDCAFRDPSGNLVRISQVPAA